MKIHALILAAGGLIGAIALAQAQTAALPPGPLEQGQDAFGKIVGDAFHAGDREVVAAGAPGSPGAAAGQVMKTGLEVPGAVFAGVMQPFAAADAAGAPAPAPAAVVHLHHRHARLHHRHVSPAVG